MKSKLVFFLLSTFLLKPSLLYIPVQQRWQVNKMVSGISSNRIFFRNSWNHFLLNGPKISTFQSRILRGEQNFRQIRSIHHSTFLLARNSNAADENDVRVNIGEDLLRSLGSDTVSAEGFQTLKQGSVDWLAARKFRLTASNFGAAVGHNSWKSPDDLIDDMLFGKFKGNDATRWGNDKEALARNLYILRKRVELSQKKNVSSTKIDFRVRESGLHIWDQQPWLAASPDGIVYENGQVGLLEIKCPFSLKLYTQIPQYYFDQIQGIMAILGVAWCDFVVWTPTKMSIERVLFNRTYWEETLLPELSNFYMNRFLPKYVAHELERQSAATANEERQSEIAPVFSSWTELMPLTTTRENYEFKTNNSGSEWFQDVKQLSTENISRFEFFLNGALQVDERLAKNALCLEFVGSYCDSFFMAISSQLERQHLLSLHFDGDSSSAGAGDSRTDKLRKAAWQIRVETVAHIAAHMGDFERATGRSSRVILDRLRALADGTATPGPMELAAVAQTFRVHIVCLVSLSQQVEERHFYPSLASGPASLGAARGRIVLASAGGVCWSTAPLGVTRTGGHASDGGAGREASRPLPSTALQGSSESSTALEAQGGLLEEAARAQQPGVLEEKPEQETPRAAVGGQQVGELAQAAEVAKPDGVGYAPLGTGDGGPGGAEFASRFSPLFQQCVVDVSAKMVRGGAGELDAVRQAFAICRRSVKERRYGTHAVRRNGKPIADAGQTAAAYEALLVRYQMALIKHLGSGPDNGA